MLVINRDFLWSDGLVSYEWYHLYNCMFLYFVYNLMHITLLHKSHNLVTQFAFYMFLYIL